METCANASQFYKPWELRDEEEDVIDDQIRDTKAQIERELGDVETAEAGGTEAANGGMYKHPRMISAYAHLPQDRTNR